MMDSSHKANTGRRARLVQNVIIGLGVGWGCLIWLLPDRADQQVQPWVPSGISYYWLQLFVPGLLAGLAHKRGWMLGPAALYLGQILGQVRLMTQTQAYDMGLAGFFMAVLLLAFYSLAALMSGGIGYFLGRLFEEE